MRRSSVLLAMPVLFLTLNCLAEEGDYEGFAFGAGASATQGMGFDIGYRLFDQARLRLSVYKWEYERIQTVNAIRYKTDLETAHPGFYLDYRPFAKGVEGLRLTLGVIFNNNDWTGDATPIDSTFTINNFTYQAEDVGNLEGRVKFPTLAPYLGFGYDWKMSRNWTFSSDFGVVYQGKPSVDLTADGSLSSDPLFKAALRNEEKSIRADLDKVKTWPVFKLTFEYRF